MFPMGIIHNDQKWKLSTDTSYEMDKSQKCYAF